MYRLSSRALYVALILIIAGIVFIESTSLDVFAMFERKTTQTTIPVKEQPNNFAQPVAGLNVDSSKTEEPPCVFMTIFGEQSSKNEKKHATPQKMLNSINDAAKWLITAQNKDNGWGAGSHSAQMNRDPHAVDSDPATTAMAAMSLMRVDESGLYGTYKDEIMGALEFINTSVENRSPNSATITSLTGTQIQRKLGNQIDVILSSQFLSNVLEQMSKNDKNYERTKVNLDVCAKLIAENQEQDGSTKGGGWAGVLQSSLAGNALESAEKVGARVDKKALERAQNYQKGNMDEKTGAVETDRAAGIVLYSVSSSSRATAKEARVAKDLMEKGKKEGKLSSDAEINTENLKTIGLSAPEAQRMATAYEVNKQSNKIVQQEDVISGFGNNGGEEFLSYLQSLESMLVAKDNSWKTWYDNIGGRLVRVQEKNGSWTGHHCITSPVFCTATCILFLSIHNDIQRIQGI